MQFRACLIMGLLPLLTAAFPCAAQVSTSTVTLMEDSTMSVEWYIGGTATRVDYDTSIVYDARYWEKMTIQAKFRSIADPDSGGTDSGAVCIYLQMSNDGQYWFNIDSFVVADSLPAWDSLRLEPLGLARFITRYATKTDSAGVMGRAAINYWGRQ